MKITIEFDTDNAAFADDPDGEVGGLLGEAAGAICLGGPYAPGESVPLRDSNGNTVGEVRFS